MATFLRFLRLPLCVAGLGLFFIAERYLGSAPYFKILEFGSLGLIFLSVLIPYILAASAKKQGYRGESQSWQYLGLWQLAVALAPVCYLGYAKVLGTAATPETPLGKVLLATWLILGTLGFFAGVGLELAHRANGIGPLAEPQRISRAGCQWLFIGIVAAALVGFNYVSAKKNRIYDWSYLKTTKPGESTTKMLKTLDKDLEIALFFPTTNEVKPMVKEYFEALAKSEPRIKLSYFDTDLNPGKAEEFKISKNGQVVIKYEDRRERIDIGLDIKKARTSLVKLDSLFQKHFLMLTAKKNVAYFTRGHDEMAWNRTESSPLRAITGLEQILRMQNYNLRFFGTADGSLDKVPDDATVVVIVGPTKPFLQEEVAVLKSYLERGGSVFVLLEVEGQGLDETIPSSGEEDPLKKFLAEAGAKFQPVHLAHDRSFVAATRSDVDKWFLYTNIFSSHESVQSLARHDERIQVLSFQTGYFDISPSEGKWRAFETVKSLAGTFNDLNRNFQFDESTEKRASYSLATALELTPGTALAPPPGGKPIKGKVIAMADATMVSDGLLRNPGNQLIILDSFKWLVGDSATAGEISSEEDVKIQHSRSRELFGFHGSIFAVPLIILFGGFMATRKRRKGGR